MHWSVTQCMQDTTTVLYLISECEKGLVANNEEISKLNTELSALPLSCSAYSLTPSITTSHRQWFPHLLIHPCSHTPYKLNWSHLLTTYYYLSICMAPRHMLTIRSSLFLYMTSSSPHAWFCSTYSWIVSLLLTCLVPDLICVPLSWWFCVVRPTYDLSRSWKTDLPPILDYNPFLPLKTNLSSLPDLKSCCGFGSSRADRSVASACFNTETPCLHCHHHPWCPARTHTPSFFQTFGSHNS